MKWYKDTEDGKLAVETLQDIPEAIQVLGAHGRDHIKAMEQSILTMNISSPDKDREFVVKMAELAGAKAMLNSFIGLLSKSKQTPKSGKDRD